MPFHLPAISRREFLARTVAVGASALAIQRGVADASAVDPDLWAFYSDSHIAESTAQVWRGEPMYDKARRVNGGCTVIADSISNRARKRAALIFTRTAGARTAPAPPDP